MGLPPITTWVHHRAQEVRAAGQVVRAVLEVRAAGQGVREGKGAQAMAPKEAVSTGATAERAANTAVHLISRVRRGTSTAKRTGGEAARITSREGIQGTTLGLGAPPGTGKEARRGTNNMTASSGVTTGTCLSPLCPCFCVLFPCYG